MMNNKYKNFILIILGFLLSLLYLWNRFFRIRIPKELPLNLTIFYFFCLLLIIFFHIVLIFKIFMKSKNKIQINFIYQPFKALYTFIIFQREKYYDILVKNLYKFGINYIKKSRNIYLLVLIAKLIIVTILFIEIFIVKKIQIFYMALMLLIIPVIYNIFIYILEDFFQRQCNHLDDQIAIQWNNPPIYDPNKDHKLILASFYIRENLNFDVNFSFYLEYIEKLRKNHPEKNIDFNKLLENKIKFLTQILQKTNNIITIFSNEKNSNLSRIIQIIISSLYIISWTYVLFISINSLDIIPINNLLHFISAKEDNIFL